MHHSWLAACIFLIGLQIQYGLSIHGTIARDSEGRVKMGEPSDCDNGKRNLEVDWDVNDHEPYTCNAEKNLPLSDTQENQYFLNEKQNFPDHACMTKKLNYKEMYGDQVPSSGTHRPIWPVYGTYIYCPPQRWLHNLEHGAIVLLYHPCANPELVRKLKKLVQGCLRRHLITPNKDLPEDYPFALLSWRNKAYLNHFDEKEVTDFIKKHGLKGRERTGKDGIYNAGLLVGAKFLPDSPDDSNICPRSESL